MSKKKGKEVLKQIFSLLMVICRVYEVGFHEGAQRIIPVGLGDDDQCIEDDFTAWRENAWPELDKLLRDEDDATASPPYTTAVLEYRVVYHDQTDELISENGLANGSCQWQCYLRCSASLHIKMSNSDIKGNCTGAGETHSSPESKMWKFLSYNVWFREDLEMHNWMLALGNLIRMHSPDVICLQEVTLTSYEIFQQSGWWKGYRCLIANQGDFTAGTFCIQVCDFGMSRLKENTFLSSKLAARTLKSDNISRLSDRNFNIGADGVIFALPDINDTDYTMLIFNSDGRKPEMCGNGVRCFTRFIAELDNLEGKQRIVKDDMGQPNLKAPDDPTKLTPNKDQAAVKAK
ncbi:hypothetical protein ACS0TY_002180 [Phlomoides rotata]